MGCLLNVLSVLDLPHHWSVSLVCISFLVVTKQLQVYKGLSIHLSVGWIVDKAYALLGASGHVAIFSFTLNFFVSLIVAFKVSNSHQITSSLFAHIRFSIIVSRSVTMITINS